MSTLTKILTTAAMLSALATVSIAQSSDDNSAPKSVLFIETAERASISDGSITLHGVASAIPVFSDRPYREAGQIGRTEFMEAWENGKDSFEVDPPNVAITGQSDGKQLVLVAEIKQPKAEADWQSYEITILEGPDVSELKNPVMVIDDFSCFLFC